MLTKKQNLLETIRGGHPDRYVNQFEYLSLVLDPVTAAGLGTVKKGGFFMNGWGVRMEFPQDAPGPFPNNAEEYLVVKDIAKWRESVKEPPVVLPEEAWRSCVEQVNKIDRNETFVAPIIVPGIFDKLHYLMGMENTLINFYEEPECMLELIDYLTDYEIRAAREIVDHIHPDAIFHHDDWGSQHSSILSPTMFEKFFVPAYQKIYGFWKQNGVELIVHHNDSYSANLVPGMIKMGIDIWQGAMTSNDIPKLVKQYGGQISFHGNIDNHAIDHPDWCREEVQNETIRRVREVGSKSYFIPGTVMGEPGSIFQEVYDIVSETICNINRQEQQT